jgi:hypothetical protein
MVDGGRLMEQQALAQMKAHAQMQAKVDEGRWTDALDLLVDGDSVLEEASKTEEGTSFHAANIKRMHARKREGNAQKTMLRGFEKGTMKIKTDTSPLRALGMLQTTESSKNYGKFQSAKRYHRPPTVKSTGLGIGAGNLVIR